MGTVIDIWEHIKRDPNYEEKIGYSIYKHLFRSSPKAKPLFQLPSSIDVESVLKSKKFRTQTNDFVKMLDRIIELLGPDVDLMQQILHSLREKFQQCGVNASVYDHMGESILRTLEEC